LNTAAKIVTAKNESIHLKRQEDGHAKRWERRKETDRKRQADSGDEVLGISKVYLYVLTYVSS
jgi:hypothetical protein